MTRHQMLSLMRLREGPKHWSDIGRRNTVEALWEMGLVHRSQGGRYYLTNEGEALLCATKTAR